MKLYDNTTENGQNYRNPVLYMDYSDPDVIRVGEDYYMVASSFTYLPGVPLLHSRDLIHWEQLAWCVEKLPFARYDLPAHGCGTWAPAIRYHDGMFYVFIPLPDEGIFVTTAKNPAGPWSELHCIKQACGWIDPCPFWDDDGSAYMAHAYAKSRCGIKHRIDVCRMAPDASRLLDDGVEVFNNELMHPTMEGPKFYKRNGWYYIFAPAGGVGTGWQVALRSRSPLGPYEQKIVLHQGNARTNGPHQGAWIDTPAGKDWFFHFQDDGVYGRILHLQPMTWCEDWPFIGLEQDGDGSSLSLMDVLSSHDRGLEQVDNSDQGQLLFRALQTLEPREREIIRLRYGLTGQPPLTQRETAKRYGISRSYISRIEKKALLKLRRALESQR